MCSYRRSRPPLGACEDMHVARRRFAAALQPHAAVDSGPDSAFTYQQQSESSQHHRQRLIARWQPQGYQHTDFRASEK